MKRLAVGLMWCVALIWLVLAFLPKKELYFLAERALAPLKVVYSGETPRDLGLLFKLSGGTIYYENMAVANPQSITLLTTIFYNRLQVEPFELGSEAAALFPARIDRLVAWQTVFYPHVIFLGGEGAFGRFSGRVDLWQRKLTAQVQAPAEVQTRYRQLFTLMKPTEEGHRYEYAF
ncbi:MAG: hypothetical protein AB7E49_01205 [Campylobacterales bacterium]